MRVLDDVQLLPGIKTKAGDGLGAEEIHPQAITKTHTSLYIYMTIYIYTHT